MDSDDIITGTKASDIGLDREDSCNNDNLSASSINLSQSALCDQEPVIERESFRKKLEKIPEETLRKILSEQVDLEVRLKHKELALTEEELGKCEAQMLALRQFFEVPAEISFEKEPNQFTLKYYDLLNRSLSVNYTKLQQQQFQQEQPRFNEEVFVGDEPAHSYRTRSTTSSLRPSLSGPAVRIAGCLYRRTDGVIVKLTCPDCQRSNFSSAQGFLNHSRIAHSKEYTSQDAAALRCGEIIPEQFQDEEGLASLKSLKEKGMEASQNLNVNEIYFNGLSTSLNTIHRASQAEETIKSAAMANAGSDATQKTNELMKKLIKKGITQDESDYAEMVRGVREPVANSHLFNDEEEVESEPGLADRSCSVASAIGTKKSSKTSGRHDPSGRSVRVGNTATDKTAAAIEQGGDGERADAGVRVAAGADVRAEVGGKYDNRLRRRKSRDSFGTGREVMRDAIGGAVRSAESGVEEDRRPKRRKSHRGT